MNWFNMFIISIVIIFMVIISSTLTHRQTKMSIISDCDNYKKTLLYNEWYSCSKIGE